jgi:hypothetical protein
MSRTLRAVLVAATALSTLAVAHPVLAGEPAPLTVTTDVRLGGPAADWIEGAVRGSDGSWYAAFGVQDGAFPGATGGAQGGADVVVARIGADLTTVVWATTLGGTDDDYPVAIALDPAGDVVVAGTTESGDFPTTAGAFQTVGNAGVDDTFVATLAAGTGAVGWATRVGGTGVEEPLDLAVGPDGRIWVAGDTQSSGYPAAGGGSNDRSGPSDAFLTAVAPDGASLAYSTVMGGPGTDAFTAVKVQTDGTLYTLGTLHGWAPSVPSTDLAPDDDADFSLIRWTTSGAPTQAHVTFLGGKGYDYIDTFAVDPSGAAYIGWTTNWGGVPLVDPIQDHTDAQGDAAVFQKLDPTGTHLQWSTYFGGTGNWQHTRAVLVDAWGSVYFVGSTNAPDTPLQHSVQPTYGGQSDAFLVKLTSTGRLVHSSYVGGAKHDAFTAVGTDLAGRVVAFGLSADGASQDGRIVRFEESARVTGLTGPASTTDTTPTWQFGTDLPSALTECSLDGGGWTACGASYTAPALGDGTHTFAVRALAGPGATPHVAAASVVVDTTADTAITKHPRRKTRKAKAAFAFTSEPGATFSCKVDKKSWKACGPTFTVKVRKGKHVLQVRATDVLGNADATPARFRWKRV